jgi:undecaprenyl pyrophosphate phosphatase UppP
MYTKLEHKFCKKNAYLDTIKTQIESRLVFAVVTSTIAIVAIALTAITAILVVVYLHEFLKHGRFVLFRINNITLQIKTCQ